ncbi:MAG: N-acetylmuramoyl-L-alanine amidase-like domain-containing protein [Candidatus Neomarinimicrobiota bacterium]
MKSVLSRLVVTVFIFLSIIGCTNRWEWLATLPKPWLLSETQVSAILPEFLKKFPAFDERIKAFALWRVGTPYEIFKLGEEIAPDTDPIIRLDVSDCTGHVLTTLAFVQSRSWSEARENIIKVHYKPDPNGVKKPTYKSRWHYTADRLTANPNTVDITMNLLPPEELALAEVTLNKKADGSEFLDLGWSRPIALHYIPNCKINAELLKKLPEVCGVSFVRKSYFDLGIIFGHEGMIINNKDLIHASQSAGETVILDFLDYYFPSGGAFFDGIVISRFNQLDN